MTRRAVLALLVIAVVITAAVRVAGYRGQPLDGEQLNDEVALQTPSAEEHALQLVVRETAPDAVGSGNFQALSETFRNTTFLLAIRDAGFLCEDVVASYHGGGNVWTASCRDMRGYTIRVDEGAALLVEPVVHYFDAVVPAPSMLNDTLRLDLERRLELLERQRRK